MEAFWWTSKPRDYFADGLPKQRRRTDRPAGPGPMELSATPSIRPVQGLGLEKWRERFPHP